MSDIGIPLRLLRQPLAVLELLDLPALLRDQRQSIESLKPILTETRDAIERQDPRLEELTNNTEPLGRQLDKLEERIGRVEREIRVVREVAAQLRGPSERVARLSERMPGRG